MLELDFEVNYLTNLNSQCCGQMYHSIANSTIIKSYYNKVPIMITIFISLLIISSCANLGKKSQYH